MYSQDNAKQLSDEVIQQVSGGTDVPPAPNLVFPPCPKCGSNNTTYTREYYDEAGLKCFDMLCNDCQMTWVWNAG